MSKRRRVDVPLRLPYAWKRVTIRLKGEKTGHVVRLPKVWKHLEKLASNRLLKGNPVGAIQNERGDVIHEIQVIRDEEILYIVPGRVNVQFRDEDGNYELYTMPCTMKLTKDSLRKVASRFGYRDINEIRKIRVVYHGRTVLFHESLMDIGFINGDRIMLY